MNADNADWPKGADLYDLTAEYIELHIRPSGPVSRDSIERWLLEQAPHVTSENVEELTDGALQRLAVLGALTVDPDPEEQDRFYDSQHLPFSVNTRFFNSDDGRTYWIGPDRDTAYCSPTTVDGHPALDEHRIAKVSDLWGAPLSEQQRADLRQNLDGSDAYRIAPEVMMAIQENPRPAAQNVVMPASGKSIKI